MDIADVGGLVDEFPARTWAEHGRPAIGVWRCASDCCAGAGLAGQLVAIRESVDGLVLMTFEDGVRVALFPEQQFRLSALAGPGVSLDAARALLDAVAGDVPAELGARLAAVRRELEADDV